ncbi:MAG: DUF5106 domain-containing protein [Bacteroidales bacterium]|nr:DUF5106 domain-containing protein [Bacteroidales bacterium]
MRRFVSGFLAVIMLFGCGEGKKSKAPAPVSRDFPLVEVPVMITEPGERIEWLAAHMWDKFTDSGMLYKCDSLTVNGVLLKDIEPQMGVFTTLLQELPLASGQSVVEAFYNKLEAFQLAFPESNMLPQLTALTTQYLYDPNSPVRSEDLYLPFVKKLAESPLIDPDFRARYAWDARNCSLNQTGTVATDFPFIDTAGKRRTLHSIKAEKLLLIFGNPDCQACKEIVETLESVPQLQSLIVSGALKVVDIYIDEDIDLWKSKSASYPKNWINGYDPTFDIRGDKLYNVRAVPSVYLLDADKRVILKDCPTEKIFPAILD